MKIAAPTRPEWLGRTVVVIASGPSLSHDQLATVLRAQVAGRCLSIAVNNVFERAPWADVFYAGDFMFFKVHHQRMHPVCGGRVWTQDRAAAERYRGVHHVKGANKPGLSTQRVNLNGNSGAQAVNLAVLWGAKRIVLVGFDMREVDGKAHFFGQHQKPLVQRQLFGEWISKFGVIARDAKTMGIEIVNATPGSAMECFPMVDLGEVLS